jgi:hypothetical protein
MSHGVLDRSFILPSGRSVGQVEDEVVLGLMHEDCPITHQQCADPCLFGMLMSIDLGELIGTLMLAVFFTSD